jgi:hypothetical protein
MITKCGVSAFGMIETFFKRTHWGRGFSREGNVKYDPEVVPSHFFFYFKSSIKDLYRVNVKIKINI